MKPPKTEAGRALRSSQWAVFVFAVTVAAGNVLRLRDSMSPAALAVSMLLGALIGGLLMLGIWVFNRSTNAAVSGLGMFAALASARIDQVKSVRLWQSELSGAGSAWFTAGWINGGLRVSPFGVSYEPHGVGRQVILTIPWSEVQNVAATDHPGYPDPVMLEVVCRDGSEVAFLTMGRKQLRAALAAAGRV